MISKKFEDISKEWLISKKTSLKLLSYEKYEKVLNKHLSCFYDWKIEDITSNDVDQFFYDKENKDKLSHSTLYTIRHVLRSVFIYAQDKYQIQTISIKNMKVDEKRKSIQILTPEEVGVFHQYLTENKDAVSLAVLLSLYTGMRTGEICALKKEDIDLTYHVIHITKSVERIKTDNDVNSKLTLLEPRNKKSSRDIPIPHFVREYLVDYFDNYPMDSQCFILSKNNNIYDTRLIQKKLQELCTLLNIKTDFNTLRNTFISYCLANNMNIKCLCEMIGTMDFRNIYDLCPNCSLDKKKEEIDKIFVNKN